jgi:hypothetical protein
MNKKALLVGINKYPNPGNELRGCINDILDMEHFIAETNKVYSKENIKKLTDKEATKKNIVAQLKWLIEGATSGDQLLFQYSGHGAQMPTQHPQIEKDGLDEIICPYDFDGGHETAFRDKEFAQIFAQIPQGVHFVWVSDSCHAEDLSRDPQLPGEARYRYFKSSSNFMLNEPSLAVTPPIVKPLNGALLSACSSNELSADAIINNRFNGAFTYYLLKNLKQYGNQPMQTIISYVNTDLAANGYDQSPQTEGLLQNKTFFI